MEYVDAMKILEVNRKKILINDGWSIPILYIIWEEYPNNTDHSFWKILSYTPKNKIHKKYWGRYLLPI